MKICTCGGTMKRHAFIKSKSLADAVRYRCSKCRKCITVRGGQVVTKTGRPAIDSALCMDQLLFRLKAVAEEMQAVGCLMEYLAGFNSEMAQHGREMFGAGCIAQQWAGELEVDD